jgi:hypothetical protein
MWSLILWEEYKLEASENKAFYKISQPKSDEANG